MAEDIMDTDPTKHHDTPMIRAWAIANDLNRTAGLPELTYGDMRSEVWPAFTAAVRSATAFRVRHCP